MPGGITRLRLIENQRGLGSPKDNGAFLLPRWPGTIGKSDSSRFDIGQDSSFQRPSAEAPRNTSPRDLIGDCLPCGKC